MIGVRYRDLIDSADKIVTMHSAEMRLESSLKEMPDLWRKIEANLVATLSKSDAFHQRTLNGRKEETDVERKLQNASTQEKVMFLVTAHEKLWFSLDRGESNRALSLYQLAKTIYESQDVQDHLSSYPFLASMWASVSSFEKRVKTFAEVCLTSRGQNTSFYMDNLDALAALGYATDIHEIVEKFLHSRSRWFEFESTEHDVEPTVAVASKARQIRLNFRSLLLTLLQAEEVFLSEAQDVMRERLWNGQGDRGKLLVIHDAIVKWFGLQNRKVSEHASALISTIPTIAQIAQTQSSLTKIESQYAGYRSSKLWKAMQSTVSSQSRSTMFQLLFGDSLRRRTRDLVQHSFVDATSTIKDDLRRCLGSIHETSVSPRHLPSIKFYESFDSIHKKVAGLDSSELQRVLSEEYIRSLFQIVWFLEAEFPWTSSSTGSSTTNPGYLVGLANILVSIISLFPGRKGALFGEGETSELSIASSAELDDAQTFEASAVDDQLPRTELEALLKGADATKARAFLQEELGAIDGVGFIAFHLLSRLARGDSNESVFVGVVQKLAEKYCEAWARCLLGQKIAPLRDFLQIEQYDMTNEEWRVSHMGWSEHEILHDDDLSDSDPSDVPPLGEKVWLPWSETPSVSSFLFSCCYALDEAYRLVRVSSSSSPSHGQSMHELIRAVLTEQLTIMSVDVYDEAVDLVAKAKATQDRNVLNFGECCVLQFLFDMNFVRATLGFSDFVRFGWGDEIDLATCSQSLKRLRKLFDRMHEFVDPVDWEIYGPQLIENVVVQFRKSRLLFSSLSEANDINEINGKAITVSAQDTRPIIKLAEPVPRFSLLPVPTTRRRSPAHSKSSTSTRASSISPSQSYQESASDAAGAPSSLPSLKLQNLLSSTTTTGTNLLSSAAKGMSFLSSATSSYLRDGSDAKSSSDTSRSKYF